MQRGHVLAPAFRPVIGREQRADAAGERDARPPGAVPAARPARASARSRDRRIRPARSRAGVAFASGWPEKGSVCGATRSQTRADEAVSPFQWIGTNSDPALLAFAQAHPEDAFAMRGRDAREILQAEERAHPPGAPRRTAPGVCWPRRGLNPVARHGVPLVAHAAGVEHERIGVRRVVAQRGGFRRDEARLAVGREEAAVGEEACRIGLLAFAQRPGHRIERVEGCVVRCAASAPRSKSRVPSFSNAESAACSRKMSAALA